MNVLAIGAHPDDVEFGCAGTLIKFTQKGHKLYLFVATEGQYGGEAERRRAEQIESSELMGAENLVFGGYNDTELLENRKLITDIENIMGRCRPDYVFINYTDDTHQDHRNLGRAAITAARYTKNVLLYEVPTTQNFNPTVYVDIDLVLNKKLACLEAHASQVMKTNIEGLNILEIARSAAHFRGIQARLRNAEAFQPLRMLINI